MERHERGIHSGHTAEGEETHGEAASASVAGGGVAAAKGNEDQRGLAARIGPSQRLTRTLNVETL